MPPIPAGVQAIDLSYTVARLADRFLGTQLQSRAFGPGIPLAPTVPTIDQLQPRQFQYPVSWNTQLSPRREDPRMTPFEQLRSLAAMYDVAAICIAIRQEEISSLPWHIVAKDQKAQPAEQGTCDALQAWYAKPDKRMLFADWLKVLIYDMYSIDAMTIYPHKDRGGGIWGFEYIDGSTIKPLLDARGQTAAYQQIEYGTPWSGYERPGDVDDDSFPRYDEKELLYRPRWTRSYTPYGFAPTERILIRVNTALRKQTFDLGHFTDSNIPAGILSPPEGLMQPEQVAAFEQWWNAKLQGEDLARQRILFLPWKGTLTPMNQLTEGGKYESVLDEWMMRLTAAAFRVTPSELGITADVNRATAESQENISYRSGIGPDVLFIKQSLDETLTYHGMSHLEWLPEYGESGDLAVESATQQADIAAGVITADESRRMRYPDLDGPAPGGAVPAVAPAAASEVPSAV